MDGWMITHIESWILFFQMLLPSKHRELLPELFLCSVHDYAEAPVCQWCLSVLPPADDLVKPRYAIWKHSIKTKYS